MLKNSIFLRVFLVIFGGVLLLTGIALFAKVEKASDTSDGSQEPIESTPPIVSDEPSQEESTPIVGEPSVTLPGGNDNSEVVVAWYDYGVPRVAEAVSDLSVVACPNLGEGDVLFRFGFDELKQGKTYRLTWKIDLKVNSGDYWIHTMYSLGDEDPLMFDVEDKGSLLLYEGEYTFTIDSEVKESFYFYVAQCDASWSNFDTVRLENFSYNIGKCVEIVLYETIN